MVPASEMENRCGFGLSGISNAVAIERVPYLFQQLALIAVSCLPCLAAEGVEAFRTLVVEVAQGKRLKVAGTLSQAIPVTDMVDGCRRTADDASKRRYSRQMLFSLTLCPCRSNALRTFHLRGQLRRN